MRTLLIISFLSGIAYGLGACAGRTPIDPVLQETNKGDFVPYSLASTACDPDIYDLIYQGIVKQALASGLSARDIAARNDGIETLRALCRGQNSRY